LSGSFIAPPRPRRSPQMKAEFREDSNSGQDMFGVIAHSRRRSRTGDE
jgi:hypothetical protein